MTARSLALFTAVLAAGCASDPAPGDGSAPGGEAIVVRLRADGFVECGGRRQTLEELIYDVRQRCRAAHGDPDRLPWLRVLAPADPGVDLGDTVDRLRAAAYDAGIRHVEFEMEGA